MGRVNRKATGDEMAHATQAIQEAFPEYDVVWGSHGDYGGGRVPRDHTLAFRLRDRLGKYHQRSKAVTFVSPGVARWRREACFLRIFALGVACEMFARFSCIATGRPV